MGNKQEPPAGSKIKIDQNIYSTKYTWPTGNKPVRYVIGTFFVIFLCGWTVAGLTTIKGLLSEPHSTTSKLSLLVWLIGWVAGELCVVALLYFLFGPRKPARLVLATGAVEYHTGTRPVDFGIFSRPQRFAEFLHYLKSLRNKVYEIQASELKNLRLDGQGESQTLTFDYDSQRIEIGQNLSEPEREWLYKVLLDHIKQFGKT